MTIPNVIPFLKSIAPAVPPITTAITSVVTAYIAAVVALISHRQWRTNQEKLRLDLYNRRFEIYLRCLNFHEQLMGHQQDGANPIDPFFRAFRESRFLFPAASGIHDLLAEFLILGVRIRDLNRMKLTEAELDEKKQALEQIRPFIARLEEKLAPFLNFHSL